MSSDLVLPGVAQSVAAARQIYDQPELDVLHEPRGSEECDAAVITLGECFAAAGGTVEQMIRNAREAAKLLSDDPLQGLAEIIQNANDVGATEVILHRHEAELFVVHNGRRVTLRDLHALAAPWLTSKRHDPRATGRFGIGLSTLHSISDSFDLHCGDYHVRLGDPTIRGVEPADHSSIGARPADTVMRVPFANRSITPADFFDWGRRWDDASLLFLDSVRKISFRSDGESHDLLLKWGDRQSYDVSWDGAQIPVESSTATANDGRSWQVHRVDVPSPPDVTRAHKHTTDFTPLAVAVAQDESSAQAGQLYAGLPVVRVALPLRFNAQFDPVTSRRTLSDTPWNQALVSMVGQFWRAVILHTFKSKPATAWANLPAADIGLTGGSYVDAICQRILDETATCLRHAELDVEGGSLPLRELAYEEHALDGLVTEDEVRRLCDADGALPQSARDVAKVWRSILEGWRDRGAVAMPVLNVVAALDLLDDGQRPVASLIALADAAIASSLDAELSEHQFVTLTTGTRRCPASGLPILQSQPGGLADEVGMAEVIAPAYLLDDPCARRVQTWLRRHGYLVDGDDDEAFLVRLASEEQGGSAPHHLEDTQVTMLRGALEQLGKERWEQLAPGIGQAVTLDCFTYDHRGKRNSVREIPAATYLPRALDSEPSAFAVAADKTPGLVWVAAKYQKLLASGGGRAGLGAHKFLRALGVRSLPAMVEHPQLERTYSSSRRRGLRSHCPGLPPERTRALRDLGADYTLDDVSSPDLIAVLRDIAGERAARKRRARANAILGMLARGWRAEVGDLAEVEAVRAHYGWNHRGTIRSAWLWEAGDVEWLDNAAGQPCRPIDLRVRTDSTLAVHGSGSDSFMHKDVASARLDIPESLGVEGEATTAELVARLRSLRDDNSMDQTDLTAASTIVYRALATRLGDRNRLRLSVPELRRQLDDRQGLIHTTRGWTGPTRALRGNPIFGDRRAFVTAHPAAEPLWKALSIREPGASECLSVMSEVAKTGELSGDDQAIVLDTLRRLAHLQETTTLARNHLRRLASLPLWTGHQWMRQRPVYVTPDPLVAEGLRDRLPMWHPGGQVQQFESLFEALRVTVLTGDAWSVDRGDLGYHDSELSDRLTDAIGAMRDDLSRNEPSIAASIHGTWDEFASIEVWVRSGLRLLADLDGRQLTVDVPARLDRAAARLYINDSAVLDDVQAGAALAVAFSATPRSIAHAWLAAMNRVDAGEGLGTIRLADERAKLAAAQTESSMSRLEQLQATVRGRRASTAKSKSDATSETRDAKATANAKRPSVREQPPRELVETSALAVTNPDGEIVASAQTRARQKKRRSTGGSELPTPRKGGARPTSRSSARSYTDLEKEERGLEVARMVLASDDQRMVDLRGQHGLGADAVDELDQYFELKVSAQSEPDTVRLEADQVRRAMTTENFFLVVVSGVEGPNASPQVRIIEDLRQLQMSTTSRVQFSGIQSAESLIFRLQVADDATDGPTDASEVGA
jgi:hypothetical protein